MPRQVKLPSSPGMAAPAIGVSAAAGGPGISVGAGVVAVDGARETAGVGVRAGTSVTVFAWTAAGVEDAGRPPPEQPTTTMATSNPRHGTDPVRRATSGMGTGCDDTGRPPSR